MDDAELSALISGVTLRLTCKPESATREAFIRRDIAYARWALAEGSERNKRDAGAALRVWT